MFTIIIVVVAVVLHQDHLGLAFASGHPLLNAMCWGKSQSVEQSFRQEQHVSRRNILRSQYMWGRLLHPLKLVSDKKGDITLRGVQYVIDRNCIKYNAMNLTMCY